MAVKRIVRHARFHVAFWIVMLSAVQSEGSAADVNQLLEQARSYEKSNDYGNAERSYRQALTLAPADPEIFKRLGVLYQTELKFAESIDLFRRALSLASQYPEVNFFLGASYLGSNQFQKATESFQAEWRQRRPTRAATTTMRSH